MSFQHAESHQVHTPASDYLHFPVPNMDELDRGIDYLQESDRPTVTGAKDALRLLMTDMGWQGHTETVSYRAERAELAAFCSWLTEEYSDPAQVADLITVQEELREKYPQSKTVGNRDNHAWFLAHFYSREQRAQVWDKALEVAYGDRWGTFRQIEGFSFHQNWFRRNIVIPGPFAENERQLLTKILSPREEMIVAANQEPIATAEDMAKFGAKGELRAVIRLGRQDTADDPHAGNVVGILKDADTQELKLVSVEPGDGGLYSKFERSVTLPGREGVLELGRSEKSESILRQLFPDKVSPTVSRKHLTLEWREDGSISIKNHKPKNFTSVEKAFAERTLVHSHLASHALKVAE